MREIKQKKHPLEGKYIIYSYGTQDYADEGWALALYRLREGDMDVIYHPMDYVTQASSIGKENIDELLRLMGEMNIKEVYSVFHLDDFFGIPCGFISLHKPEDERELKEIELWAEWKSIDDYMCERLKERGIEVVFYNEAARQRTPLRLLTL